MPLWEKGLIAIAINTILILVLFKVINVIDKKLEKKSNQQSQILHC